MNNLNDRSIPQGSRRPISGRAERFRDYRIVAPAVARPVLSLTESDHPSYLLNSRFEIEWTTTESGHQALSSLVGGDAVGANILCRLFGSQELSHAIGFEDLLQLHIQVAKQRISKATLLAANAGLTAEQLMLVGKIYDCAEAVRTRNLIAVDINLSTDPVVERWYTVYVSFFREGCVFTYTPSLGTADAVAELLSRRDVVIRDILRHRKPFKTRLAVLVADLANSTRLSAELPPEEYFDLINEIWNSVSPHIRKYQATLGKHVGDGMVAYFLPQSDSHFGMNAVSCAAKMRETVKAISEKWQQRKGWLRELKLNIGLDEGEEWFGTCQTPTHLEFTVLGDTVNRCARLSDFAQEGTIWATKALISSLPLPDRSRVSYGVAHRAEGRYVHVPNSFARISDMIASDVATNTKLRDIANLAVGEVVDVADVPQPVVQN